MSLLPPYLKVENLGCSKLLTTSVDIILPRVWLCGILNI